MPRRARRGGWVTIVAAICFAAAALGTSGGAASAMKPAPSVAAQPRASSLPSPPRDVIASPGNGFATVHWGAPASTGSGALTGYVVTVYVGKTAVRSQVVGKNRYTTVRGLKNAHQYAFHVAARNRHGRGKPAVGETITVGAPTVPTSVQVTRGERKANIRWHAPGSVNGKPITGYVIVPYLNDKPQKARSYSTTALNDVVANLAVGRSYRFRVGARNANGVGPRSPLSSVVNPASALGPDAPPPPEGYFPTLAPIATLPSEAACDGRVNYSPWEPRPQNNAPNHRVPKQPLRIRNHPAFNATWQSHYRPRVTGNFTGTTDEIIEWAACKWGLSDEILRAQAVAETSWRMSLESDFEPRSNGHCVLGDRRDPCPTSFGILQIKWYFNPDSKPAGNSYPMSKTMTAFSLDYAAAKLRGCYEGWEYFGTRSRGDLWGCLGAWFSGSWHDAAANAYIERVKADYHNKPWRNW